MTIENKVRIAAGAALVVLLSAGAGFGGGYMAARQTTVQETVVHDSPAGCWTYTVPNRSSSINTICLESKR